MSLLEDYAALTEACGLPRYDCQIVPYHPALLQMMDLREPDRVFFDRIPQFDRVIAAYNEMGHAYVGCHKGKPIIIVGCITLWPGVCELWMLTDTALTSVVRPFWTATTRLVDILMDELSIVRVQCTVSARNPPAIRFIKALKFSEEGLLTAYGPDGSDFFMYARLNNGRSVLKTKSATATTRP
jgi:hypothetical protein|tara:strand:- start:473 stop:1024 length:552 start_codon:yes stop_codon:yes gene_type:complete